MADLQEQIDALIRQMKIQQSDLDSLERRADASDDRADAADLRADAADQRVAAAEIRAEVNEARADSSEAQAAVDREMIGELQRDGVLSQEHAAQMEQALRSSRTVGAAIGLIMGTRGVSESEAFQVLNVASQNSNRKLRDLAAELVAEAG